jgi:uncharacterized SAM-binding protein YcdF (DUF218 family)
LLHFLADFVLLPPAGLLLLCALGLVVARRRRTLAAWLLCSGLLGLLLLSLPIVSKYLLVSLEAGIRLQLPAAGLTPPPAAIVILGGDGALARADGAIVTGAQMGPLSLERVRAGAALHMRAGLPVLVTGGSLAEGAPPIAALMAQSLDADFHVTPRWVEPQASDTWENARLSAAMLAREGINAVYVVTQPWHMRRALIAFAHAGIAAWPAPTSLDMVQPLSLRQFHPTAVAFLNSYYALHEWLGCADYALRR